MHIFVLIFIFNLILPLWAQDEALPLPALSFDEAQWYFNNDKATIDRATEILNAPSKSKRFISSRDIALHERADDVDQELLAGLTTGFQQLFQDNQLVEQVDQNIAGNPVPGDFGHIDRFPAFADVTLQAAYVFVLPRVGAMAPAQVPRDRLSWTTAGILGMVWLHLTDPEANSRLKQMFRVERNGLVQNGCPKVENNDCGNSLCQGVDEICQYKFTKGCKCTDSCPNQPGQIRWFICDEEECGGADDVGKCKGATIGELPGENKGCHCAHFDDDEPYIWDTAGNQALQDFIDAGPWKDDPPENYPKKVCKKDTFNNDWSNPDVIKFLDSQVSKDEIVNFCKDNFTGNTNTGANFFEADRLRPDESLVQPSLENVRKWDLNWMGFRIEWEPGAKYTVEQCINDYGFLNDNCDWSGEPRERNPNWYNWKWGGTLEVLTEGGKKVKLFQNPITPRSRTEDVFNDDRHWWEDGEYARDGNGNPDFNKRLGKNGKPWDGATVIQCLHGMIAHEKWFDKDFPWFPCADIMEFSISRSPWYLSLKDCYNNVWEPASKRILKDAAITGYANHKADDTGANRCWLGIRVSE